MKRTIGEKIFSLFNGLILVFLVVMTVYPILHVAFASISDPVEISMHQGVLLFPKGFTLSAYVGVLKNPMILSGYINTMFVVVVGVSVNILLTSLGAYFLSRKKVFWKKPIMFLIVFTMYFNGGLIPFFFTVKELGWINTLWALIFPVAINTFNMIIMRTAFMSIPDSLEESAKLDGANDLIILFKIIIPLSLPVLMVMVLYYGVERWNSWFNASVFIRSRKLYPLQLVLRDILIQNDTDSMMGGTIMDREAIGETIKYATIMVVTLPVLFIYPFLQKYFIKGVLIGALKE